MTPKTSKPDQPTFIEEARRKQIIDAALQTIADQGYTQTSFAEIANVIGGQLASGMQSDFVEHAAEINEWTRFLVITAKTRNSGHNNDRLRE